MPQADGEGQTYTFIIPLFDGNVQRQSRVFMDAAVRNVAKICRFCFKKSELLQKSLKNMSDDLIFVADVR